MAYYADRVWDTATFVGGDGTNDFTLNNASPLGFTTFGLALIGAARVSYVAVHGNGQWEVGKGTYNGAGVILRELVRSNSLGFGDTSKINFAAGDVDVMLVLTAEQADNANMGLIYIQSRGMMQP